jgi:hypothetical protein
LYQCAVVQVQRSGVIKACARRIALTVMACAPRYREYSDAVRTREMKAAPNATGPHSHSHSIGRCRGELCTRNYASRLLHPRPLSASAVASPAACGSLSPSSGPSSGPSPGPSPPASYLDAGLDAALLNHSRHSTERSTFVLRAFTPELCPSLPRLARARNYPILINTPLILRSLLSGYASILTFNHISLPRSR